MINIDLDNVNEEAVYRAFNVDGNEAEALNDSYLELFELIGRDAMLKLFKYFRGDKIDCPMRLYRPEFIAKFWRSRRQIVANVPKLQELVGIPLSL